MRMMQDSRCAPSRFHALAAIVALLAAMTTTVQAGSQAPTSQPAAPAAAMRKDPPVIILKLDDLKQVHGKVHLRWQQLADFLESRHLKASIGVICQSMQEECPTYCKWIQDRQASGQIEFWFHGWDHAVHEEHGQKFNEFTGRSYEQQKQHFDESQKLAREKLGFAFATFGPPGGVTGASFDQSTMKVMSDDPFMKVWLYPCPIDDAGKKLEEAGKVVILDRVWQVNLEGGVGHPDYDRFVKGYTHFADRPYFVLQGHPAQWDAERFAEFTRIIDYLVQQKAVFMTPSEYAATLKK